MNKVNNGLLKLKLRLVHVDALSAQNKNVWGVKQNNGFPIHYWSGYELGAIGLSTVLCINEMYLQHKWNDNEINYIE